MTAEARVATPPGRVGWSLAAHFASSLSIGVAIGGMVPLTALTLEHRGVGPVMIGVNAEMTSLGGIAAAPLVPTVDSRPGAPEGIGRPEEQRVGHGGCRPGQFLWWPDPEQTK